MTVTIYIAVCEHETEEMIVGIGGNRRLVEIQHDSFMSKPENRGWKSQIQTFQFEVSFVDNLTLAKGTLMTRVLADQRATGNETETKTEDQDADAISEETQVPDEGE